ncbi:Guanine nucleotide-binding protein alpha-2 subunit [Acorus calamus]|uniref:Guanine nucleotide-binding protein alpha-2 subunit n=1 Tax=Acorus calamus TaxID=4465 RepID=A0AAV9DH37_ACOCL|nr:Guanine nucleotide-binding protein alpha-2 subunit [Acorus calamus]
MATLIRRIPPIGSPALDISSSSVDCSFAVEYDGPPVPYDIPRAIPIDVDRIPVASIVASSSESSVGGLSSLPVVQPILSPPPDPTAGAKKKKREKKKKEEEASVSPTSVIAFDPSTDELEHDQSGEIGSSLKSEPLDTRSVEILDGQDDDQLPDRASMESSVSPDTDDGYGASAEHGKRGSVVTFQDDEATGTIRSGPSRMEGGAAVERKKGSCYRCLKGSRFTEKEACVVCDAKYCINCVLKAMGSMPEGRKCITCIGHPIEESKRGSLGKCSRLLKKMLSELEIQQVMKAERTCENNQLQAECVFVNGKQLYPEEMVLLQTCPNPPGRLKPGRYWYDKVSGFWGEEGHKPSAIISAHLNVGSAIKRDASNGNTNILINNREITKTELQMLKWAGVQCAGNPHFWVNADGSYQEEGQKNIRGHIWRGPRTRLICSVLSLPFPPKTINAHGEEPNKVTNRTMPDYIEQKTLQKLLLVGWHGAGTSTIFKQAKFLYKAVPFSEDELEGIKLMIQTNAYNYLGMLLEGRERFEEECLASGNGNQGSEKNIYSIGPRLKAFSDWLLKVMASGSLEAIFPAATREYAPLVEELWNDAAIQATYERKSELQSLPTVAGYFLKRVVEISRMEYQPSDMDILQADGVTSSNGLASVDFLFPQLENDGGMDSEEQLDPLLRYQLIRVPAKGLGENCKWLEMFEDVRLIIFCVALSDYDQQCDYRPAENKMLAAKSLFENIVSHSTFDQTDFLLILNKFDLFEQKLEQTPLTVCDWFDNFNPVRSLHQSNSRNNNNKDSTLAELAYQYIAVKFKRLYTSLTGRRLYVTMTNGLDSDSVGASLRYGKEIIKWEGRAFFGVSEYSVYSTTEPSSY